MGLVIGIGIGAAIAAMNGQGGSTEAKLVLTPVFEDRERFERRTSRAFDKAIDDNRSDLFNRQRVGISYRYGSDIRGQFIYQYSSNPYWSRTINASTDDSDLIVGNVAHRISDGWLTAGVQFVSIGNQRILGGATSWNNFGTSWDAVRYQKPNLDLFVARLALAPKNSKDARIVGGDYDSSLGKTLLFFNHDRVVVGSSAPSYDVVTLDQDFKKDFRGYNVEIEAAGQWGKQGAQDVRTWAAIGRVSKQLVGKLSGYVDGQMESGGKTQNEISEFTTPYGQNHLYNGPMDIQGGSNKRSLALELNYATSKTVSTELLYTRIGLFDDRDAWFGKYFVVNKIGSVSFVDPTGRKGRDVGQEVDLSTKWQVRKDTEFSFGASEFLPGAFVKAFVPSGQAIAQMWFFTQVSYKFAG